MSAKKLCYCAMSVALAGVASFIRFYEFPFGGSVTLFSMLFILLPAWFYGVREGMVCGLIYGLFLFVTDPWFLTVPQFILDYILAFSVMGLGGLFKSKSNGLLKGYLLAVTLRWAVATLSGLVWVSLGSAAWDGWAPLPYSMAYNGAYIFTEALITVIVLVMPPVKKGLERVKQQALG